MNPALQSAPGGADYRVTVTDADGESTEIDLDLPRAAIGKSPTCAVRLAGWRVGREHALIIRTPQGLLLEDQGHLSGTWVNGSRVVRHGPLTFADQIQIAGHTLRVQEIAPNGTPPAARVVAAAGHAADDSAGRPACIPAPPVAHRLPGAAAAVESRVQSSATGAAEFGAASAAERAKVLRVQARHPWRKRVHDQLLETIDLRRRDLSRMSDAELRTETEKLIRQILDGLDEVPPSIDRAALSKEVLDEAIGLGPLEELLEDETVTEVMVNRHDEIFVERAGRLQWYPLSFTSDRAVMGVIERIVAPLGRRIDESSPLVDARLKDGSRVNAIIPPLALKGPTITIRKFPKKRLSTDDMVGFGSVSAEMVTFLKLCVEHRKNVIVSGGTGSGKTTFLNLLSNFIPDGERIITIEDAAELKLNHSHLVSLESRPSNVEGRGAISIRDLVKNALRMRPDRIVVGECRGGEALDMLQAMNTGHEGSMTTLHANTPRDALARLETLVLMAGMDLPITAIREQITSAVDVVIQQSRFSCGSRKVTSITEITGMENGRVQLQELFCFEAKGHGADGKVLGNFAGCDAIPSFYDELREQGADVDLSIFGRPAA